MFNVLLAEDDPHTRKLMAAVLRHDGYEVFPAENGLAALDVMDRQQIDVIVLDVMMPEMDGYELCDQLRRCGYTTPILMVTAKHLPEERCRGFIVGTDDYMVKPVNEAEMLLRIKALLRRAQIANERKLNVRGVTLDYDALSVSREGASQTLPPKEFYLLYKLLSYPGKIFTRMQLMDEIWGADSESDDATVKVHVNRLRKRFAGWPEFELVAVRGIGYKAVVADGD